MYTYISYMFILFPKNVCNFESEFLWIIMTIYKYTTKYNCVVLIY